MALNLLQAGYGLTVFNRDPSAVGLVNAGATQATTPAMPQPGGGAAGCVATMLS